MTTIMLTLRDIQRGEAGTLIWNPADGSVTGFRAEEIASYGSVPWTHSGSGIGDGQRPALQSNDGMIALLMSLGYAVPPELHVEVVPFDDQLPGAVN